METGLAGDKRPFRDKEMSRALELQPCHSEGCTDPAVWHQVWLINVGGVPLPAARHIRPLTSSF